MNEKANYGNWVPEKALYMLFGAVIVLGVIAVAVQVALSEMVIAIIVGVLCILTLVMAIYMLICHEAFAFGKVVSLSDDLPQCYVLADAPVDTVYLSELSSAAMKRRTEMSF